MGFRGFGSDCFSIRNPLQKSPETLGPEKKALQFTQHRAQAVAAAALNALGEVASDAVEEVGAVSVAEGV